MKLSTEKSTAAIAAIEQAYLATREAGDMPDWLNATQANALTQFSRSGFPTTRHEDWKYTNLARLAESGGALLGNTATAVNTDILTGLLDGIPRQSGEFTLVFVNGRFAPEHSELLNGRNDLRITTLATADTADGKRFTAEASGRSLSDSSFAALNQAFMTDGLLIEIAAGADVPEAIHVVFATDGQPLGVQARLIIHAGERSSARVFEHHVGRGAGWTNAITDVKCARASQLTYIKLQNQDPAADHIAAQHVVLENDSMFRAAHFDLGARLARNDLNVRLTGRGSHAQLSGLYLVDGERHVDNHTRIDHIAGHTVSTERYRGIMNDRGRGVFNGKIIVHKGADGTDAQLDNRNLLLADTAEIDTKPELEIYTDEVKCAHGATTGQLDEHALFYLRARGIPQDVARHMLITAFAREVTEQVDVTTSCIAEYINQTLERRLPE